MAQSTGKLADALKLVELIEFLTSEECDSLTLFSANPDFTGEHEYVIDVCGPWTGGKHVSYFSNTVLEALQNAVDKRKIYENDRGQDGTTTTKPK